MLANIKLVSILEKTGITQDNIIAIKKFRADNTDLYNKWDDVEALAKIINQCRKRWKARRQLGYGRAV